MRLFHWRSPAGNFGDDLNLWLWDALLPGWRDWDPERWLIGVGTVLNSDLLPSEGGPSYLVVGSGVGFGRVPDVTSKERWDLRFVRGPLSARALGLPDDAGILDPAALTARLPEFSGVVPTGRRIFVPHCHSDLDPDYDWPEICTAAGLEYLSPRGDAREVIRAIAGARLVLTESMHGAIVADAFRVPWRPVSLVRNFNEFKWRDWGASLGLSFEITPLPRALRAVRDVSRQVARRIGLSPRGDAASPPAAPARGERRTTDLIRRMQGVRVARVLLRLASSEPYLSSDGSAARQADRAQEALARVATEYASGERARG